MIQEQVALQLSSSAAPEGLALRMVIDEIESEGTFGRLKAVFIRAGQTKPIVGYPEGVYITASSIRDGVLEGFFNGAAIYADHAPRSNQRSILELAGFITSAEWDGELQGVRGFIRLIPNDVGENLRAIFEAIRDAAAAGEPIPDVGLSLDANFTFKRRSDGIAETIAMTGLKSVDAVHIPAAGGRVLAQEQQDQQGDDLNMLTQAQIDERLAQSGLAQETITQLSTREWASMDALNQAIAEAQNAAALAAVAANGAAQQPATQLATQQPASQPATQPAPRVEDWIAAVQQTAVPVILSNSGLPQASIKRLQGGMFQSPDELRRAIEAERAYLAALAQDETVQMGQRPRRGVTSGDMTTPDEEVEAHINWFFGVPDTAAPPINYRRLDVLYVALTGDIGFTGVFDPTHVQLAASPVTLPNLAVNAMNKVMMAQFSKLRYWRWYELVTTVAPNDGSLHTVQWITYGGTGNLPLVDDGGAYTEGNIGDARETSDFDKHGRYVGITRKMIKNSEIARIQAVPIALATDSVRTRSSKVSALFTSNSGVGPTLRDGNPLFHSSRSNVATTALGTTTAAWDTASTECFGHTEVGSGKVIGVFPKYNLVPAALYRQSLANFGYGDGSPTSYNPFAEDRGAEDPRPVPLVVPDWTDATDWAYVTDPDTWPVIMMSYSQNPGGGSHPQPELFTAVSEVAGLMFTNDMLPIKVRDEYAVGVNGGRGIGKRNVA